MRCSIRSITQSWPRVADEVGAELAVARAAERHVVAQDVVLGAVGVGDRGEVLVRGPRALGQSSSSTLSALVRPMISSCSAGAERAPRGQVVQVLLHHDVAAARELRVVVGDHERRVEHRRGPSGSRCRRRSRAGRARRSSGSPAPRRPPSRRRRARRAAAARTRSTGRRARPGCGTAGRPASTARRARPRWIAENGCSCAGRGRDAEPVPRRAADADVARELAVQVAEPHRAHQRARVAQHLAHRRERGIPRH